MSHCAGRCTVNAPSGCAASQDLQCVHVRNTQHSLPVQVEGYTRCDPCLPAPACCNQHIGRTPNETREGGGRRKKEIGTAATAEGIAVRSGGVDIYEKMFGVDTPSCDLMESRLGLHVKAATPPAPPSSFLVCLRGFAVDENTKRWEEKNDTESCLICCVYRRWMMDTITHL